MPLPLNFRCSDKKLLSIICNRLIFLNELLIFFPFNVWPHCPACPITLLPPPTTCSDDGDQQVLPPEAPSDLSSSLYSAIQLLCHVLAGLLQNSNWLSLAPALFLAQPIILKHPSTHSKAPAGWHHSLT